MLILCTEFSNDEIAAAGAGVGRLEAEVGGWKVFNTDHQPPAPD
jgi:hypothetical protein